MHIVLTTRFAFVNSDRCLKEREINKQTNKQTNKNTTTTSSTELLCDWLLNRGNSVLYGRKAERRSIFKRETTTIINKSGGKNYT